MEEKAVKSLEKRNRDEAGKYLPNHELAGPGRPEKTEEDRLKEKALEKIVEEYREVLFNQANVNKKGITEALITKALKGDVLAIKELNDRLLGKSVQKTQLEAEIKVPMPLLGGATKENE
mgnify:CR=1 FL=1